MEEQIPTTIHYTSTAEHLLSPKADHYTTSARSAEIGELVKALAGAQGKMRAAAKNKVNPHLKSKYADLASIHDVIRQPLAEAGLAVTQIVEAEGPKIICFTELLHTSGQWIRGRLCLHSAQTSIQQIGAAITYARRYALSAILGIASDEEDDGEADKPEPKKAQDGKYKQIRVSEPQPVASEPAPSPAPAPTDHQEFVQKAAEVFNPAAPATDEQKTEVWNRCKAIWPDGTTSACESAMKASKLKPINWKTATIGDLQRLKSVLSELENLDGTGAPM